MFRVKGRTHTQSQAFFNSGIGQIGSLGCHVFDAPIFKYADIAIQKRFGSAESNYLDIRATSFGRFTGSQSGLYFRF